MAARPLPVPTEPVEAILKALLAGSLSSGDLTARQLGAFLGKTTGHVYHHWGSLDGLLFSVSQAGFAHLARDLRARHGGLEEVAVAFVDFGLEHPALYELMFERRFDWAALREQGRLTPDALPGLGIWGALATAIGADEARLLFAGLHGLVSLAASGRANIGALTQSDREVARTSARLLVRKLSVRNEHADPKTADPKTADPKETKHDLDRDTVHPRPADPAQPPGKERDERAPRGSRRRAE
jgi:AcrR family transcriptional regulator